MTDPYHMIPVGQAGNTSPTGVANARNPTALTNNALGFLEQFEGLIPSTLIPYPDGNGLPTVGIGWRLDNPGTKASFNADAYLIEIGVPRGDPRYQAMVAVLNRTTPWLTSTGQPDSNDLITQLNAAYGGTVPPLSSPQVSDLWNQIVLSNSSDAQYTKLLNILTSANGNANDNIDTTGLLNSKEGLALFTMSYNGAVKASDVLLKDLNQINFNRADAWFQIRYETNLHQDDGVAKRQYAASEIFGLYAPGDTDRTVPKDEALAVYAELSKQFGTQTGRTEALAYEAKFSNDISQANDSLAAGYVTDDSPAITGTQVQTLGDELQPAANALIASLNDKLENPYYGGIAIFDPRDIQVAVLGGGSDLVATARNGYQLGTGAYTANSALLIAQGGNDTLDDTAAASGTENALIGGTNSGTIAVGTDTFKVGNGNDYIVAGSGNALIEGSTTGSAIGSGNDTIVLGEANAPWKGGNDTVWGGSGNDVYYLGLQSQLTHIHLGSGQSTINVVYSPTDISALALDATSLVSNPFNTVPLAESLYEDLANHELVLSTLNPDGTKRLEIFELPPSVANSPSESNLTHGLNLADVGVGATDSSGELIIDGYTGNNLSGIQLTEGTAETVQSSNLSQLVKSGNAYFDNTGGPDSVYGSDTSGSTNGNVINGEGDAGYIYAGNGNNQVFTGEEIDSATTSWVTAFNVTVQGGSGNQWLVGFGNSNETIIGGDVGQDTTAWDTIDGGGGNGLFEGGTQNSVIYGGTGQDTLIAGSGGATGYNPKSFLLAGLSFWNGGGIEPGWSTPGGTDANFQVTLFNGTETIGLLGSALDPATGTSSTLPGSLLIGGTGSDELIGNQGNDTLIGGTPLHSVAGVNDEVLVGGAGADLIYAGDGNEWIYADMPASVANWADADPGESDTIYGGSGNDAIYGSGGNDEIYGGTGNYSIRVGDGNSYVETGSGTAIVYGGSGADTLVADGTADQIYAGTGNTKILAEGSQTYITLQGGNDTISLDAGINTIVEGSGATTLVTGLAGGSDTVYLSSQETTIQLTDDLSESDVAVSNVNGNLVISDLGLGGQITLAGYFTNSSANVSLQFADGTTWGASQIQQQALLQGIQQVVQQATQRDATEGTPGNDFLLGTQGGDDLIDGEGGNDYVDGGNGGSASGDGNDVFVFNGGYGQLEIHEFYNHVQLPVLLLGEGIDASALKVTIVDDNLILTDGIDGDQVTLDLMAPSLLVPALPGSDNGTSLGQYGVVAVQFDDGTTLTRDQLYQMEVAEGTTGNDYLVGSAGAELIDGKGGDDSVYGNGGNDTVVFNAGYGTLYIDEFYASGEQPVLKLGPGITAAALHAEINSTWLILTDGVSGDEVTFDLQDGYGIKTVILADGSTLTRPQLIQMAAAGTTGNDTMTGTAGADMFDGKGGVDSVVGNGGSDTFVFDAGYGQLAINEDYAFGQQPVLQFGAGITASMLQVTSDGISLFLADGIGGDKITLEEELQRDGEGVQSVTFADGTSLTMVQLDQMEMTGTTGNDTLFGSSGDDSIDGRGGNDSVIGAGGNDTFIYNSGYGHMEINEVYTSGQQPVLQLGAGISAASLHVTESANNLIVADGVAGDQITLDKMWSTGADGVAVVTFSNGTSLTRAQLIQMEMTGTSGNDTLNGTSSADLIDGEGGSDSVVGGGGNDTFVFNSGYGHLEINETHTGSQQPILQMGAGITVASLHVTESANNVIVADGVTGDQITLDKMWSTTTNGVGEIIFSDGTTLSRAQLIQMEMIGTTGNDTLNGTSSADLIDGKGGSDSVVGSGGNDTFVYSSGYGHLEINEVYTSSQQPLLQFGAGITAASLHVTESTNNLVVTDGVAGDQITLDKMWSTSTNGVGEMIFSDGTTLSRAQLIQMEMTGTTGNDTLNGSSGADLIDGKGGSDSVVGGGGNDTIVFNSGYGHLQINEVYTSGQQPVLELGAGITASALKVAKSGNNLVLTDGVSGDQVTFNSMWTTSTDGVAKVTLADGTSLTRSQLISLGTAPPKQAQSAQSMLFDNASTPHVNSLIHAIAGYTGGGAGDSISSSVIPAVTPELMLHSAA